MERRSTSVLGFVHYGGEVRNGVAAGIGFNLGHASTGSTAWIESISDDTNANLGIRAQGAGTITIGTSSNAVAMPGGAQLGAGGTFKGAYSTSFAWTLAAVSSGQTLEITLSTSVGPLNPKDGDVFNLTLGDTVAAGLAVVGYRFSSVAASVLTILVGNISSTATSTTSGTGRINWIDLT
jgi:hypothetical protein